jgi:hypothetical protein
MSFYISRKIHFFTLLAIFPGFSPISVIKEKNNEKSECYFITPGPTY